MTDSATMSSTRSARRAVAQARWGLTFTRTLIYVILVTIAIMQAFPLIWMIVTSVKDSHEVFNTVLPTEIKWQNFPRVWFAMNFPVHLGNSLYVTSLTVALVVAFATPAAYAFARYRFPGREVVFYTFIGAMMIPPQAILIPMFQFLKTLHLLNSLTGLALSYVGGGVAFAVFLMRTFFLSLPGELGELGADRWLQRLSGVLAHLPAASACRHGYGCDHSIAVYVERVHVRQHADHLSRQEDGAVGGVSGGRTIWNRLHRAVLRVDHRACPGRHHLSRLAAAVYQRPDRWRAERLSPRLAAAVGLALPFPGAPRSERRGVHR